MAFKILFIDGVGGFLKPLFHQWGANVIIIAPALVTGVVGRIDEDAIHFTGMGCQQGFQSLQIVAVDNQIVRERGFAAFGGQRPLCINYPLAEGHTQMV